MSPFRAVIRKQYPETINIFRDRRYLRKRLSQKAGIPIALAASVINVVVDAMVNELEDNGYVHIKDFITMKTKRIKSKQITIPYNNRTYTMPEKYHITFRVCKKFIERMVMGI